MKLNPDNFDNIKVRPLTIDDFEALLQLQRRCFKNMDSTSRAEYESQLYQFQEGQIGVFLNDELVGSASSLVLDLDEYSVNHTWSEIADDGFIRNHDEEGDTLYGYRGFSERSCPLLY